MEKTTTQWKRFWFAFAGLVLILGVTLTILSREPNRPVKFVREVPTSLSPEKVGLALHWILSWPQWHHMTTEARRLDGSMRPYPLATQSAQTGALVEFVVEPREQKQRRFIIQAEIEDYVPNQKLSLRLLSESSGKLQAQFQNLRWTIEIVSGTPHGAPGLGKQPTENGTLIRGTLTAETRSWRSRLFSRVAERILLNQIFYPNLTALAELKEPQRFDPTSAPAQN
jgi:hypothetical protein